MTIKKFSICFFILGFLNINVVYAQLVNIGTSINSEYSELNPLVTNGGNRIYFVVADHPENYKAGTQKSTQDIWYSDKDSNGVWSPRVHMAHPLNTFLTNGVEAADPNGNTLIIKGAYVDGVYKERGYSITRHTKEGWSKPEKMSIGNYAEMDKGAYDGLTLCPNGKAIIISFAKDSKVSKQDLYIAFREGAAIYSKPILLNTLNTEYDESAPYIASDNRTLYFASNRPGSTGSQDIYMSKRIGDDWDKWTTPVNVGPQINTDRFDSYYSIDPSDKFSYIVSTKKSIGKEDIFMAPLDKLYQPEHIYIVGGQLLNGVTMKPLDGTVAYHDLMTTTEHGSSSTENGTGEYTIFLEKDYVYGIDAAVDKYISLSYYVDTKEIDSTHIKTIDLYLFPIQVGTVIPLDNLFFKVSSATILPESATELNRVSKMLLEYPAMKLKITGYTDNTGTDALNQKLSLERAEAVKKYFVSKGLSERHFEVVGLGNAHPVASNASATGRQKNRRVEITIVNVQ